MQFRQTPKLESLFSAAKQEALENGFDHPTMEHLLMAMLDQNEDHASHILKRELREWEIKQIRKRIEQFLAKYHTSDSNNKSYAGKGLDISNILMRMAFEFGNPAERIFNTAHLLYIILSEHRSPGSRVMGMYNITPVLVSRYINELPPNEDFYGDMNYLENMFSSERNKEKENDTESSDSIREIIVTEEEKPDRSQREEKLSRYVTDLTLLASDGKLDPVSGRDNEIERMIQILGRRKKNNPVLIGEPGVGKSAIVEGLAIRIAAGDVPRYLVGKRILSLNLTSLVAGTKYRGDFEERIKMLLDKVDKDPSIILFIDEIHTIVGAGNTDKSLDTANILKPALARGTMQCIGATTLNEYRTGIEADGALERRFQKILVEEPRHEETIEILKSLKAKYEQHHCVRYTDSALEACVNLSGRYITDRFFPDKAIDIMDEAGSRARYRQAKNDTAAPDPVTVDSGMIAQVISAATGIPVESITENEQALFKGLNDEFGKAVIGQSDAISKVTRAIMRSRVGLRDPGRPIGVFLFTGPTGVGKTLLAKEIACRIFKSADALIKIDMSEYSTKHNVSRMIGSPPGYVGYGEGGQLTEKVRRRPYSVVLLDEIEKAHPDTFNLMLQIFDSGELTDGQGRKVDFRNTIIIMTSNIGSEKAAKKRPQLGFETSHKTAAKNSDTEAIYRESVERFFSPEFLNRIDETVMFNRFSEEDIYNIVALELGALETRLKKIGYSLVISEDAKRLLAVTGYDDRYGARSLKRTILERVESPIAEMIVYGGAGEGNVILAGKGTGDRISLKFKKRKGKILKTA